MTAIRTAPIRTAVIGYGLAGRIFHTPLIAADPRYQLTAVVTGSADRAASARADHPGVEVLADTDALFDRAGEFDLVVVASPNETHAPLALKAVAAGLNVVLDKPVAVTRAEAQSVVDEAARAGVVLSVFQNRRWDGDFLTLAGVLERGEIGEVRQFESAFEWWKPALRETWKDRTAPGAGGGILYDLGPHLIDQAVQLFGEVGEVHAELDRRRPGVLSDDDSFVTLHHTNGVRSRLWMSAVSPAPRPRFRVVGSEAVFRSRSLDPQEAQAIAGMRPGDAGFGLHTDPSSSIATIKNVEGVTEVPLVAGDHLAYYRLLGDALLDGAPVPVDPADSVRALGIIEEALGR